MEAVETDGPSRPKKKFRSAHSLGTGSTVRIVGAYQELDRQSLFHFGLMF